MILLDVNILVQVHREDADSHAAISEWLHHRLREPAGVAVSDLALSGCLRVVTHSRIFSRPTPLKSALEFVQDFRARSRVHVLEPSENHWNIFLDLCRKNDARGNLIPDAYHAALAMETGSQWASLDRGFSRFRGLNWLHPLDEFRP